MMRHSCSVRVPSMCNVFVMAWCAWCYLHQLERSDKPAAKPKDKDRSLQVAAIDLDGSTLDDDLLDSL